MIRTDPLSELAARFGIEPEFVDAHGTVRRTAAATQRALLAALGVDATSEAAAVAALAALDTERWAAVLPPVVVAARGDLRIPLTLPVPARLVAWTLTFEDGGQHAGSTAFDDLALIERCKRDGVVRERRELPLPADVPLGYHRLTLATEDVATTVIVTPGRCWLPESLRAGARLAGLSAALYLLRSDENWGIGDFTDLRGLVALAVERGADVIGLNPLHEMFLDDPEQASPYSPASRLVLNPLNIDLPAIPEFGRSAAAQALLAEPDFAARLAACRSATLVDYSGVAALKLAMLRLVYAEFRDAGAPERRAAFARARAGRSAAVERTFVFLALREHFARAEPGAAAWQRWPAAYRDPESATVARFAREHADEVSFIAWLEWVADEQLAAAARAAAPMRVGLYRDLAVGADPAGAETWLAARAVVAAARVGAPPDIHNPGGQNWGLPPFHPQQLRAQGYRSFIELVRANMRHAGGLRIDHVMALQHAYWIPDGAAPAEGAYVQYPLDDLLGILALESHRARCLVVGEDLGTVPAGFRERLAAADVLSYRVLFFERESTADAAFIAPAAYPRLALAVVGSHDLPTLGAWWNGADIRLRERIGLLPDGEAAAAQRQRRAVDRAALVAALQAAGVLAPGRALDADTLFAAVHDFLAATTSAFVVAQLDDVTAELDPVNVPTTTDEHANWRRRQSRTLAELRADPRLAALFDLFAAAGRLRTADAGHLPLHADDLA